MIFFALGQTSKTQMSGGEKRFIEVCKRLGQLDKIIVNSKYRLDRYDDFKKHQIYIIKDNQSSVIGMYLSRIAKVLFFPKYKEKLIFYSTSDCLPSMIYPALFKTNNKKWVQCIYHLVTHPSKRVGNKVTNIVSYCAQKISHFLIKRKADLILVDNSILKTELIDLGFDGKKIEVISMGVDFEKQNKTKPSSEKSDAIIMARLHPSKGIFDLPVIWAKVVKKIPNAKLTIIGHGERKLVEKLKKEIEDRQLSNNITLKGYLDDKGAISLIKSSKIFLNPSHEEGWGITNAEALVYGVPVISWNLPIYSEIFGDNILQIPKGDTDSFSEKIIWMLNNPSERTNIVKKGRKFAKKFSWEDVAKHELELILNLD